jgi:hypothetical protein
MTRNMRRAIVQLAMIATLAISAGVALPMASKYGQQRAREIAEASKKPDIVKSVAGGVMPQILTVGGCLLLSLAVGFAVARALPPADTVPRRPRRG